MTKPRPERPRVKEKVAYDPVVQAILDQVHAPPIEETSAPAFGPAATPVKGASAGPVFGKAMASNAFAKLQSAAAFAKDSVIDKAAAVFKGKAASAFARPKREGRKLVRRVYIAPPPRPRPKPSTGWWLPVCEFLSCFEDSGYGDHWWRVGDGWDFDEAAEGQAYLAHGYDYAEASDEEEKCTEHRLVAAPFHDISHIYTDCDFGYFEGGRLWFECLDLMRELRFMALAHVTELVDVFPTLQWVYKQAGIDREDMPDDPQYEIVRAVLAGDHDTGIGAMWADEMILEYPRVFGVAGAVLDQMLERVRDDYYVQRYPEQLIVFDRLHPVVAPGRRAELMGRYRVTHSEYRSALPMFAYNDQMPGGFIGWTAHFVTPIDDDGQEIPE